MSLRRYVEQLAHRKSTTPAVSRTVIVKGRLFRRSTRLRSIGTPSDVRCVREELTRLSREEAGSRESGAEGRRLFCHVCHDPSCLRMMPRRRQQSDAGAQN